jgi:futalosine hydrolase
MRRRALDVLVAGATLEELAQVRVVLGRARETGVGGRPLAVGRVGVLRVAALVTGVGKANAALGLGEALAAWRPRLVLAVGVGGAFPGSGLDVGDLAVAGEEWYGDEGVEDEDGFRDM